MWQLRTHRSLQIFDDSSDFSNRPSKFHFNNCDEETLDENKHDTPRFSIKKSPTFKIMIWLFAFGLLLLPYLTKNLPFAVRQLAHNMQYLVVSPSPSKILDNSQMPALSVIRDAQPDLKRGSLILAFEQNKLDYYSDIKFIRHYDPRLTDFYKQNDKMSAHSELLKMGITHVYLPLYSQITQSLSQIREIISDPNLTELIASNSASQFYRLKVEQGKETAATLIYQNTYTLNRTACVWFWPCKKKYSSSHYPKKYQTSRGLNRDCNFSSERKNSALVSMFTSSLVRVLVF